MNLQINRAICECKIPFIFDDICRNIWLLKVIQKTSLLKMLAIKLRFFTRAWLSRRKKKSGQKEDVNWDFEGRKYFLSSTDSRCGGSCENNTFPPRVFQTPVHSGIKPFDIFLSIVNILLLKRTEEHICDHIRKTKKHSKNLLMFLWCENCKYCRWSSR